ncbi:GntR family transcriptional regulator [Thermodesulfobacteriota bacterium]
MPIKPNPEKIPLGKIAYGEIYRRIVSLKYEPGQRLEESVLVEQLGIGRTPIREALLHLMADLLVESLPGKGYIVRPITVQNTKAAFEALSILELGVARLAVRQEITPYLEQMKDANVSVAAATQGMDIFKLVEANSSFHHFFASCSRNMYLIQGLQRIRCETNRLAYLSYGNEIDPCRSLKDHYHSVIEQHDAIIQYVKNRDLEKLEATLSQHIEIFKKRMINYLTA